MTDVVDAADVALRASRDRLAAPGLTYPLARLYAQHVRLSAGRPSLPSWRPEESDQRLSDVIELVDIAADARRTGDEWRTTYRRAGEIFEWLAHPGVGPAEAPLELLGAACYQLAGYPARAQALLDNSADRGSPLLRLLLTADFARLLDEAPEASWGADTLAAELRGSDSVAALDLQVRRQVAASLGVIAADFRWGAEPRKARALVTIDAAAKAMRAIADPVTWLTLRLAADVVHKMTDRSLRPYLNVLSADLDDAGRRAFEAYGRNRFLERRLLAWPSQRRGLDRLASGESFVLCTPTGSGKTTVAEVALLQGLFTPGAEADFGLAPLCLYIVPTRALAAEVESKLANALRFAGGGTPVTVTGLYGGTDWGPTDAWLASDEPTVLICTQEKAEALVRYFGAIITSRLRVVVIDEAHEVAQVSLDGLATGESRALRLEALVTRLRATTREDCRYIAMSAVAQGLDQSLARWMVGSQAATPVESDYRSTRQVVGRLQVNRGRSRIVLDVLDGVRLQFADSGRGERYIADPVPPLPEVDGLNGVEQVLAPYSLWTACHLASSNGPQETVLISLTAGVRNWANWFVDLLRQWDGSLPSFFDPPSDPETAQVWAMALDAMADYFGADSREHVLLEQGVAVYYSRMPGRLPRLLVRLIEKRAIRVVLSTSSLSQGVNLPFETVVLPKLRRQPEGRISRSEFWNLVGRAGRPGVATEGRVLVLENLGADQWRQQALRTDFEHLLTPPDPSALSSASPLARLIGVIRTRLDLDEADLTNWLEATAPLDLPEDGAGPVDHLDVLDGFLLAALEERAPDIEVEDWLRTVWRASFAAASVGEEVALESTFLTRGRALAERIYPDAAGRRAIYLTSLPPRDAVRIPEIAAALREYLLEAPPYRSLSRHAQLQFVRGAVEILARHLLSAA